MLAHPASPGEIPLHQFTRREVALWVNVSSLCWCFRFPGWGRMKEAWWKLQDQNIPEVNSPPDRISGWGLVLWLHQAKLMNYPPFPTIYWVPPTTLNEEMVWRLQLLTDPKVTTSKLISAILEGLTLTSIQSTSTYNLPSLMCLHWPRQKSERQRTPSAIYILDMIFTSVLDATLGSVCSFEMIFAANGRKYWNRKTLM